MQNSEIRRRQFSEELQSTSGNKRRQDQHKKDKPWVSTPGLEILYILGAPLRAKKNSGAKKNKKEGNEKRRKREKRKERRKGVKRKERRKREKRKERRKKKPKRG